MSVSENCRNHVIDFIVKDSNPQMAAVEDEIRNDLAKIGMSVTTQFLNSDNYTAAELNGDYNILFAGTWGAPYDPHSYMESWAVPSHVEYSAIGNLAGGLTRDALLDKISNVLKELDEENIAEKWKEILNDVHQQAIFLPLYGTRVPYVYNRRIEGFAPGTQSWAFPMNNVKVTGAGSRTVTVAPGSNGMFKTVGPMHPHLYAPNELYVNAWIYEGLLSYGENGRIEPALATKWDTETTKEGQRVTFTLRENVRFHDGSPWNCDVCKLNFDHVLSDTVRQRHQWFGVPKHAKDWYCTDEGKFVLETSTPFYPLLQELTYVRPLVMASALVFADGLDSHPEDANSCEPDGFGAEKWDVLYESVNCLGLSAPIGTGPFKFERREFLNADNSTDARVVFAKNEDYWGGAPTIDFLEIVHYEDQEAVEAALRSGELDMALGIGPLTPKQVKSLESDFTVRHSDVLQTSFLIFNTNKKPTDDINVRKAIIHAIDKATFIEKEFAGLERPVYQLMAETAPYCDVDLAPKWSYDYDKAILLNCPEPSGLTSGAIAGIVIACVVAVGLMALVGRMIYKEKRGEPMFAPGEEAAPVEKAVST